MNGSRIRSLKKLRSQLKKIKQGAKNAIRLMQDENEDILYTAPFERVFEDGILKLRHYLPSHNSPSPNTSTQALLLIPPLMVTSEIYDISPELSAINQLTAHGIDVWLADFGAPEKENGWDRTIDDHILAIDSAIDWVTQYTKQPVHIAGYSQGGMFAYQVAAYRKSKGIQTVITFGSPVDFHRNMPLKLHDSIASKLLSTTHHLFRKPLDHLKGVSGDLNSLGFKLTSPKQEIKHLLQMIRSMHDEEAIMRLLPKRRFLGGAGFTAWPGPALRGFVDNYVVHNRLLSGGVVINQQTVSLKHINTPILYFVGQKDDFARPPAVRAIHRAVTSETKEKIREVSVEAGHFGLVVGSKAMTEVWPEVIRWVQTHSPLSQLALQSNKDEKTKAFS